MHCAICGRPNRKMSFSRVACDECCDDDSNSDAIDEAERDAQGYAEDEALRHYEDVCGGNW